MVMNTEKKLVVPPDSEGGIEMRDNPVPRYFTFLFYGLVIWGVIFSAYFLLSGWSSQGEFAEKMTAHQQQAEAGKGGGPGAGGSQAAAVAVSPEALRAEGEELYGRNCAACHGADGGGGIGPALTAPQYNYGKGPEAVKASIADGRPGGMPGFGNQLSAAQIEALAHFVTSLGQ